jgi:hypothetical protein
MDGTPRDLPESDRPFDCSRLPASECAEQFVAEVVAELRRLEARQRARRLLDEQRHAAAVTALVLDLLHRQMTLPGGWIAVSLDKAQYRPDTRKAPFLTEAFPQLVSFMAKCGLVDIRKGEQGAFGTGKRTTIRAGKWLLERMEALEVFLRDIKREAQLCADVLVLRSAKVRGQKKNLTVPATTMAERLRSEVAALNDWLARADLWWAGDEAEDRVDLGDRMLRRIFNNGSLELGGRLYGGFWQRVKSELRLDNIRFGDHPAVSLDFGQMAIRSAYFIVGAAPPHGDLYEVPGLERYRHGVKQVLNALLAADQMPQRFPVGTRGDIPKQYSFRSVLVAIERHHNPIRPLFGTGMSLRFMYLESCILVQILLRLRDLDVAALPIHDCLLVSQEDRVIAREVMTTTFKEILGSEPPIGEDFPGSLFTPKGTLAVPLKKGA